MRRSDHRHDAMLRNKRRSFRRLTSRVRSRAVCMWLVISRTIILLSLRVQGGNNYPACGSYLEKTEENLREKLRFIIEMQSRGTNTLLSMFAIMNSASLY